MWMFGQKRWLTAMAACGAALVLGVGCSDDDGVTPIGGSGAGGGGGSSSAGRGGNAAGGKAGAPSGGAPSGGAPSGGAPGGGAPGGGAPSGGAPSGGAPSGGAPSGGAPSGGAPSGDAGSAGTTDAGAGGDGGASGTPPFVPAPITVLNANFETGNDNQPAQNWQSTGDTAASYVHYDGNSAHSGYGFLAFYSSSAYSVDTTQTINGLANGTYEYAAWIKGGTALTIYAKNYSGNTTDETKTDITPSADFMKYSVTGIQVTAGKITIGVRTTAAAGGWANIDDVTLTRVQ